MTSGLRKIHKYIWIVLAVLVPFFIVFSVKDLNVFQPKEKNTLVSNISKQFIVKSAENELIKASITKNNNKLTLEVILKKTLKNASCLVYKLNSNQSKGILIGEINTLGIYNFEVEKALNGIILYDSLKNTVITTLKL